MIRATIADPAQKQFTNQITGQGNLSFFDALEAEVGIHTAFGLAWKLTMCRTRTLAKSGVYSPALCGIKSAARSTTQQFPASRSW